MGAGAVLVNELGEVKAEFSTSVAGTAASHNGYELFALVKGLQLLDDIEYKSCIVYSDHRSLVHSLLYRSADIMSLPMLQKNHALAERLQELLNKHSTQIKFRWQSDKNSEGMRRAHNLSRRHIKDVRHHKLNVDLNGGYLPVIPAPRELEFIYDDCSFNN